MDKNISKKLDGRYEITELIGVGGMADVYKGVDVIDNKSVAVKILKKEFAENEEFLRRFRNESKAIAVLSHPNIVKIYDVGFSEKIQYIVMEYIDGITLKEYIEDEKVLTWKDTVHFLIQILRALQHAHDKGIVHRDIKPQNIMMFTDGTIKVMDFGIAKFARENGKTATDQAIGSVHYISPEQARGDVTDEKSDIYSIGAMMYEMLTGSKPFDGDNAVSIAVMHMHDTPQRPKSLNPDIPDGLEEILLKAMEKNPEDRYQSTTEMIADIEAFKANPEISFGYYTEGESVNAMYHSDSEAQEEEEEIVEDNVKEEVQPVEYSNTSSNIRYNNDYDDDDEDDDDDDEEEEERSSLVVPVLTAAVVVVIIVAVIFVVSLVKNMLIDDNKSGDFIMPDFYGMDYNDAVQQYGNNINIQKKEEVYNENESGSIIEQDIAPGTEFKKGAVVNVTVSRGMETAKIPENLINMNVELARMTLQELGIECTIKNSSSSEVDEGNVIKTEPEVGTEVSKGETIILYVSMGIDLEQIVVDNYVGDTIDNALYMAEYNQIKIEYTEGPSYDEEGIVYEQDIEPGTKVEAGTVINLKVSNGVLPEGDIPFTIEFPEDAEGRFVIDFLITDEDGVTRTVTSSIFIPQTMGRKLRVKIPGAGENVTVQAYLTNYNSGASSALGEYSFNFETQSVRVLRENIHNAFVAVDGLRQEETEPPTEAPTQAPTQPPVQTQPPTEPEIQTQPPTEAPTPEPTEPPTEAPTPEPTEPPTEAAEDVPVEQATMSAPIFNNG